MTEKPINFDALKDLKVKESVTLIDVADFFSQLLQIDEDAVNAIFSIRVGCNDFMACHPSVQVAKLSENYFLVGLIGLINGIFGADQYGWGHFSVKYDKGKVVGFEVLTDDDVRKRVVLNKRVSG